jgi:diguanylate cyclase (GGDEF)-like protein
VQLLLAVAHQLSLSVSHARVFAAKEQESLTDVLTNCLNRRAFERQLEKHFQAATERSQPMSLIIIDLDLFKSINDNYGHPFGDEVLRRLAEPLLEERANGAIPARIGGEEFALILPHHSIEEAAEIAERVRQRAEMITLPELACRVTVSCGVASAFNSRSPDSLFAAADKALYRAKTSGRNRVCLD